MEFFEITVSVIYQYKRPYCYRALDSRVALKMVIFKKNHNYLNSHPSKLFHLIKKHFVESLNKILYLGVAHKP